MTAQVEVRDVERWLLHHGFTEMPRKASGHRYFENGHVKVVLPGHGPNDLTKKHVGMLKRQLTDGDDHSEARDSDHRDRWTRGGSTRFVPDIHELPWS